MKCLPPFSHYSAKMTIRNEKWRCHIPHEQWEWENKTGETEAQRFQVFDFGRAEEADAY